MKDTLTDNDARESLEKIKQAQRAVTEKAAKEYMVWSWWGLYVLIFYPPFDYFNGNVWGPILLAVWPVGSFLTFRYYRKSTAFPKIMTPKYIYVGFTILIALAIMFAEIMHPYFHFAWTVAGLVVGLSYWTYAAFLWSKNKARV